jgi:hypothetical protein
MPRLSATLYALILWCALAPGVNAASHKADAAMATQFAQTCMAALTRRDWPAGLACIAPGSLQSFADKYLEARVLPTYTELPTELRIAFGEGVTRAALQQKAPIDLLSGALDGAIANSARNGRKLESFNLTAARVEHRIAEVYRVHVRALVVAQLSKRVEIVRKFEVRLRVTSNGPFMDVPSAIVELLGLD